ncbi:hypothetical protein OJ998_00560 [Solirubrobacter taibaiensis]|nr:hypothetical protein [Solirubrobacter taibaiensis]
MPRAVSLAVLVLFVVACGGDEPPEKPTPTATPDPAAQVREIAPKVISTAGGYELCFENSTDRFIRAVFKGDREKCRNVQQIVGSGTPKVLDVKVAGEQAIASVAYEGSALKGPFGTVTFVREDETWKLDEFGDDFLRSTAVVSVRALSEGALSVPEVQECVAQQTLKLSDAAVRKYVYSLFRVDAGSGRAALRLVEKCPKAVAIYVAEEIALQLRTGGYSRRYIECLQPRLRAYMTVTGVAPTILSGSESKDFGTAAISGLIKGTDEQCRRYK